MTPRGNKGVKGETKKQTPSLFCPEKTIGLNVQRRVMSRSQVTSQPCFGFPHV